MQALILSGGQGTRLRPLTLRCPKPLLPIANQSSLNYPIALLRKHGIGTVVICTADSSRPYRGLIRQQKRLGTTVICSAERKELGTAGALKNAERHLSSPPFFTFNGDDLTSADLTAMAEFHRRRRSLLTIALLRVSDPTTCGLVLSGSEGRIDRFVEKPSREFLKSCPRDYWVNAGIYLFERELFDLIPAGRHYSVEKELIPDCLKRRLPLYSYRLRPGTYWIDIGTPAKYLQAHQELFGRRLWRELGMKPPVRIAKSSRIHPTARIGPDTSVGENCRIGAHCRLEASVLLEGVRLEEHVTLRNVVIGSRCRIGHHATLLSARAVGEDSRITPYSQI